MKIIAITQARYSSSRLPGKVLLKIGNLTILDLHLQRIKKSSSINKVIVATTQEKEAEQIVKIAQMNDCSSFQGDLNDVLDRFYQAAKNEQADYIIRLTSDCPLVDPHFIDELIKIFLENKVDYAANCVNPTLPDGMDAEMFTFAALEDAWKNATKKSEREHVTPYIKNSNKFKIHSLEYPENLAHYRLTLDTREDFDVIKILVESCGPDADMKTYVNFLKENPLIYKINSHHERNEGLKKSLDEDNK